MGRQRKPRLAADDVPLEIEVAVQRRRRNFRRPVDGPQRRPEAPLIRIAQALAERCLELVAPIGRFERFLIEALSVDRCADDHCIHAAVSRDLIRPERVVAVPETEIALVDQRLLPLAAPGEQELHLRVHSQRTADLDAVAAIVIAVAVPRPNRREARFRRGDLPTVVGGGQVVELATEKEPRRGEERSLEAQRITAMLGRRFVGQMAGDERVIEATVIEYGGAESERRNEAVDGGEPVLALAEVGNYLEAPRGLAQADEQHAAAVAFDEVERSP